MPRAHGTSLNACPLPFFFFFLCSCTGEPSVTQHLCILECISRTKKKSNTQRRNKKKTKKLRYSGRNISERNQNKQHRNPLPDFFLWLAASLFPCFVIYFFIVDFLIFCILFQRLMSLSLTSGEEHGRENRGMKRTPADKK